MTTAEPPLHARFTRTQVIGLSAVSGVLSQGSFYVNYLPAPTVAGLPGHYYSYVTTLGAGVPLLTIRPSLGLRVEGVQFAALGATLGLRYGAQHDRRLEPYWAAADNIALHVSLYTTYVTYREARLQGASDRWNDRWRPATLGELLVAPVRLRNLAHPVVYATLAFPVLIAATTAAANSDHPASSGPAVRDTFLGLARSLSAGVTEEAFFRGVFYEELKTSLGRWPAGLIDSTAFALAHVPGDIRQHSYVGIGLVSRGAVSLLLEAAYDQGGLPESVALHTLYDAIVFVTQAIYPGARVASGSLVPTTVPSHGASAPIMVPLIAGVF